MQKANRLTIITV